MGRLSKDATIQTCWDADRLDLGRVGERPNPTYLGTKAARDPEFIKSALLRSKNRFVSYQFAEWTGYVCSLSQPASNTAERETTLFINGSNLPRVAFVFVAILFAFTEQTACSTTKSLDETRSFS